MKRKTFKEYFSNRCLAIFVLICLSTATIDLSGSPATTPLYIGDQTSFKIDTHGNVVGGPNCLKSAKIISQNTPYFVTLVNNKVIFNLDKPNFEVSDVGIFKFKVLIEETGNSACTFPLTTRTFAVVVKKRSPMINFVIQNSTGVLKEGLPFEILFPEAPILDPISPLNCSI